MRVVLAVVTLAVVAFALVQSHTVSQDILSQSTFLGRSGDILVHDTHAIRSQNRPAVTLLNLGSLSPQSKEGRDKFQVSDVADLLRSLFALPRLAQDTHSPLRAAHSKVNLMDKPKVNVLFVVPGMSQPSDIKGRKFDSDPSTLSVPLSPSATIATALTGDSPSQHGVINDAWLHRSSGQVLRAFARPAALPVTATVFESLSHVSGGVSAVLSFGGESSYPRVMVPRHATSRSFLVKLEGNKFSESNPQVKLDIDTVFDATKDPRITALGATSPGPNKVTFDSTVFDLTKTADAALINTLTGALSFAQALVSNKHVSKLFKDSAPDAITFTLDGADVIASEYGITSPQYAAACALTTNTINLLTRTALRELSEITGDRLTGQALFTGVPARETNTFGSAEKIVLSFLSPHLLSPQHASTVFPNVYFKTQSSVAELDTLCTRAKSMTEELPSIEVYCNLPVADATAVLTGDVLAAADDNVPPTQAEINEWQLLWWSGVILVVIAIYGSYCLCCMELPRDPMIYAKTKID